MTEIPEHLLKRSRERREAAGLPTGGGDSGAGGSTSAPVPAAAAAPKPAPAPKAEVAAPPPPKPEPAYIKAARTRRRIPFWAMPVVGLLPIWLFIYMEAVQPPKVVQVGPLAAGEAVYAKCASCHGTAGEGGVGYQLSGGEVIKSFTQITDQLAFVYTGNKPYAGKPYGTGRHIGGQKGAAGTMPAWGSKAGGELSDVQLLEVICYERYKVSIDPTTDAAQLKQYNDWCTSDGASYQKVVATGLESAGIKPLLG